MAQPRLYGPAVAQIFRPGGASPSRTRRGLLESGSLENPNADAVGANQLYYARRRLAELDSAAERIARDREAGKRVRNLSSKLEEERNSIRRFIGDMTSGSDRATAELARRDRNKVAKRKGNSQTAAAKKAAAAGKKGTPKATPTKKGGSAPTGAAAEGATRGPGLRGARKANVAAAKKGKPSKKVGTTGKPAPAPKTGSTPVKKTKPTKKTTGK